ncbi:hypothetical protein HDU79_011138 [Rhizoclosmatium sp. JEL0117]|nr:hypothetical protein HDU79_011138 [Rhizoclosmatium sp. JEL0117]
MRTTIALVFAVIGQCLAQSLPAAPLRSSRNGLSKDVAIGAYACSGANMYQYGYVTTDKVDWIYMTTCAIISCAAQNPPTTPFKSTKNGLPTDVAIGAYACSGPNIYQYAYVSLNKVDWILLNTCASGTTCKYDTQNLTAQKLPAAPFKSTKKSFATDVAIGAYACSGPDMYQYGYVAINKVDWIYMTSCQTGTTCKYDPVNFYVGCV